LRSAYLLRARGRAQVRKNIYARLSESLYALSRLAGAPARRLSCAAMPDGILRRLAGIFDWESWAAWFAGLEREFVFLLVLPFVVAIIGLWASFKEKDRE
jgi:hypothetical protein